MAYVRYGRYLTACNKCGNGTSRGFARRNKGQCKACAGPTAVKAATASKLGKGSALPKRMTAKAKELVESLKQDAGEAIKTMVDGAILRRVKAARFSISATMLAQEKITVTVIDDQYAPPACIDLHSKRLTLNDSWPKTNNAVEELIFDRAKLYHEVGHALYTKGNLRKTLSFRSRNRRAFLDVSNILEDGREERKLRGDFAGTGDYLDAILAEVAKQADSGPIGGLVLHVRSGLWRNEDEAKHWQPYQALIAEAVAAEDTAEKTGTDRVCEIAFDIVEKLYDPAPKQPQQPDGNGEQQQSDSGQASDEAQEGPSGADDNSDDDTDDKSDDKSDDEGDDVADDSTEGSSDADSGDKDDADDEAADDEAEDADEDSNQEASSGADDSEADAEPKPEGFSDETWEALQEIVQEAKKAVAGAAKEDLDGIIEEALSYEVEQEYSNEAEATQADRLTQVFESLKVEAARVRSYPTKAGLLNTSALANALTSRRCFVQKEDAPSTPHVALLLDVSGSMGGRIASLASAARVLNGALRRAKINVRVFSFGGSDSIREYKVIEDNSLWASGGTPTGLAMRAANDWMEQENASRPLVIVCTDGGPNYPEQVDEERQRLEAMGGCVVGVLIGFYGDSSAAYFAKQFSQHVSVQDVSEMAEALEPVLGSYIIGA